MSRSIWYRLSIALLTVVLAFAVAAPVQAATTPWTPVEKTIITAPKRTHLSSNAFINEVCHAVKAAPAGATIRVATYWSSDKDVINCFITARKNGAYVRYTTWQDDYKANKKLLNKLKKVLNDSTGKSYFMVCSGSCYKSGSEGTQHAKIVTISEIKGKDKKIYKDISFISSGNFSKKSSSTTWNYSNEFVGRPKIHDSLAAFMDSMKNDKTMDTPKAVTDDDINTTIRFYPGGDDSVYETLKDIKSGAVPEGYGIDGKGGKAVVRVVMYYWSGHYAKIADELVRIKGLGADVRVAIKANSTKDKVVAKLKSAGIPLYDTAVKGTYAHGKVVVVSAKVGSHNKNLVFSGSVNLTEAAFQTNTEVAVEQQGASYRDRGLRFYDLVEKYSKPIK